MSEDKERPQSFYNQEGELALLKGAQKAVEKGSTAIGIKTNDFAVLSSYIKRQPLSDPYEKVFGIDNHIGATGSGLVTDMQKLIDELRVESQRHRLVYDTPIDVLSLVIYAMDYLHQYTVYTVRPQAISLIIAGADQGGIKMYKVDSSGAYLSGQGFALGEGNEKALKSLEKGYNPDMSLEQATKLSHDIIKSAATEEASMEQGIVDIESKTFKKLLKEL